ncbi:MAG: DUF4105 domain-containing protein [Candidatus Pacebacteria bacterium]|nr:DUF4105 domain-containing protein [Candidatus Paceibacterota bacterium]
MKKGLKYSAYILILFLIGLILFYCLFLLLTKPSNNRDWAKDMKVLSAATIMGDIIILDNVRNNNYRSTTDFDVKYYQGKYDINKLKKVYLITDPFGKLSSHTMLSFEFSDNKSVVMSVEIRREEGEVFENFKGMFRGYELYYVWADEKDVIKLRTNYRMDNVYMYELDMAEENVQKLFIEAMRRTNQLKDKPEFYNLLVNNCTTNIAEMLQVVYNKPIIVDWRYLVPAYAEGLSMKYDLIQGSSIEDVRKNHNISPNALICGDCNDYSNVIRKIFIDNTLY